MFCWNLKNKSEARGLIASLLLHVFWQEEKRRSAGPNTENVKGGVSTTERDIQRVENRLQQVGYTKILPGMHTARRRRYSKMIVRYTNSTGRRALCRMLGGSVAANSHHSFVMKNTDQAIMRERRNAAKYMRSIFRREGFHESDRIL